MAGLCERLIGAWQLVSYVENPTDGSEPFMPFGEKPQGIIMYTPDGYMSAQLGAAGSERQPFASGDWFDGTAEEYREEATSYIAYSGKFFVDEEAGTLKHNMFVSLFPNWIGQVQPRKVEIVGDELHLGSVAPLMSAGKEVQSTLVWKRMEQNTAASENE